MEVNITGTNSLKRFRYLFKQLINYDDIEDREYFWEEGQPLYVTYKGARLMLRIEYNLPNEPNELGLYDFYSLNRGKGEASTLMNFVTDLCDKYHVQVELSAYPGSGEGALTEDQLISFYERKGFEKTSEDNDIVTPMKRTAKALEYA